MKMSDNEILCPISGEVTQQIIDPVGEEYVDENWRPQGSIDEEGNMWVCWKEADAKLFDFHVCTSTSVLMVNRKGCDDMMQFIGHDGISVNGQEYKRRANGHSQLAGTTKASSKAPRYNVSDKGRDYMVMNEWHINNHFWWCPGNQKYYSFSPVQ